jgi:predicted nucleic acid-binding protein
MVAASREICIDASVAAKWLLREGDRGRALALRADVLGSGGRIVAPYLLIGEVTSAIYKKVQTGQMRSELGRLLTAMAGQLSVDVLSPPHLPLRAFEIASQFGLKWIYDAFYVALAEIVGCDLWTADGALHEAVRAVHTNVHLLAEYPLD